VAVVEAVESLAPLKVLLLIPLGSSVIIALLLLLLLLLEEEEELCEPIVCIDRIEPLPPNRSLSQPNITSQNPNLDIAATNDKNKSYTYICTNSNIQL